MKKEVIYPPTPEPLRIEFEVTNFCNANCIFCPRFNIKKNWFMDLGEYKKFILKFKKIKKNLWIDKYFPQLNLPVIVFWGYWEPLMNKDIFEYITYAKKHWFSTEMITNGYLLTKDNCKKIVASGLDKLAISLHTLNPDINKKIMWISDTIPTIIPNKVQTFMIDPPYTKNWILLFIYKGLQLIDLSSKEIHEFYVILNQSMTKNFMYKIQSILSWCWIWVHEVRPEFGYYVLPKEYSEYTRAMDFLDKNSISTEKLTYSSSSSLYIFRTIQPNLDMLRENIDMKMIYKHNSF